MWPLEIGLFILLTLITLSIILLVGYTISIWVMFIQWLDKVSEKFWSNIFEHHSNKGQ